MDPRLAVEYGKVEGIYYDYRTLRSGWFSWGQKQCITWIQLLWSVFHSASFAQVQGFPLFTGREQNPAGQ